MLTTSALAAPVLPFSPYGQAQLNGANVPAGTEITAWCGSLQAGRTIQTISYQGASWYYNLEIRGDDPDTAQKEGCAAGETVSFKINAVPAAETAQWSAASVRLDLNATEDRRRYLYLPLVLRGR